MHLFTEMLRLLGWALVLRSLGSSFVTASFALDKFGKSRVNRDVNMDSNEAKLEKCLSGGTTCVSICCQPGSYYNGSRCNNNNTFPASELQYPQIHNNDLHPLNKTVSEFTRVYGSPCKYDSFLLNPEDSDDAFYFLEDGVLYMPNYYGGVVIGFEDYCIASKLGKDGPETRVSVCAHKRHQDYKIFLLYPVTLLLSTPFLIATIIVYSVIPELRNLHGLCLRIHMTMLCLTYIIFAVLPVSEGIQMRKTLLCKALAVVLYFLYLGTFFWLNVICIDIWWTFGGFGKLRVRVKQQEGRLFVIYSIFAWGSISLLTGLCIAMDYIPRSLKSIFPRPEFGVVSCCFRTRAANSFYFYGPMGLTVICNICLFVWTAVKMAQHEKNITRYFKGSESKRHDEQRDRFHVCLKLFILMGVNWTLDIISWIFVEEPVYFWYIGNWVNTLQGPILFFVLVWNARVKRLIAKRFGRQDLNCLSCSSRSTTPSSSEEQNPDTSETYRSNPAFNDSDEAGNRFRSN